MLPPELIIRILGFTDYLTIKNYRKINRDLVDNNINFIFQNLKKIYPFLKYGKKK